MKEPWLCRLANRLILRPTAHAIPVEGKQRRVVRVGDDVVEVWFHELGPPDRDVDLCVLKFPGTGGRAERATDQPASFWPHLRVQIQAVNPPGYGGSTGCASLRKLAVTARTVFDDLRSRAGPCPLIVMSNSLGGAAALHLAATRPVDALILRNPPPLREVILGRYALRGLYLGPWLIACQVPSELDCLKNARRATMPAVFVMSARDTIVPPEYQRQLHDAYAGPKQLVVLSDATHASPMGEAETEQYRHALDGLLSELGVSR
jgi:uncharacterized protein